MNGKNKSSGTEPELAQQFKIAKKPISDVSSAS